MIFRAINNKRNSDKPEGFTLMEMLVSMAIFAVISVLMSNIVLSIASFSLDNERRTDFLAELDGIANNIKNDLRGTNEIGFCDISGVKYLYYLNPNDPNGTNLSHHYVLTTNAAGTQAIWKNVVYTPATKGCSFSGANSTPIQISAVDTLNIQKVSIARACEDKTCVSAKNTLLYVMLDTCDPVNSTVKKRIFDCAKNPYRYEMAISTRNIQ
jgi:prepilin-type N-terminal cleavage/methylation domain-containing protein